MRNFTTGADMALQRGSFVRHPTKGDAVVVGVRQGNKLDVLFDSGERLTLGQSWVEKSCKVIEVKDLAPTSKLCDPATWDPPTRARGGASRLASSDCPACNRPLNRSQYSSDHALKSCPKCSASAGVHVFFEHPAAFGTTDARVNDSTPDGVQSYCAPCRAGEDPPKGVPCSQVSK